MSGHPLLVDLADVPAAHCDNCLDDLFRTIAIDLHADAARSMWRPHENPWLTAHVEDVTRCLSLVLERLQDAPSRALTGEPIGSLAKAEPLRGPGAGRRWLSCCAAVSCAPADR
ncbi:hypothetical protein RQ831_18890 [Roseomonas gilardii]|uniref:Uncharacterized protein n=1 Tax=Roseomonas gilardii TaxID=257708 RepID=A0A1L7ABH3_9PROT|nr:hypothetical protein [Roseomonas gilardii]APT56138.1 hypothetical protein RGI145_02450 [Roseomonas gilardii]MDT8333121.1 hypothetical protein [Roseomonas gilardii]